MSGTASPKVEESATVAPKDVHPAYGDIAAAPAASAPLSHRSHTSTMSAAMRRYLEEEKGYKQSKRAWSRPTACFTSRQERISTSPPSSTAAVYDVKYGTIETEAKKAARKQSSCFASHVPQRTDPVPSNTAPGMYQVRPQKAPTAANSAFRSTTPRLTEPRTSGGPSRLYVPKETQNKSRGVVAYLSVTPRMPPASKPICNGEYDITKAPNKRPQSALWARSAVGQRPEPKKTADVPLLATFNTDISVVSKRRNSGAPVFHSTTPRFIERKSTTPPPGAYASKYISHGM